MAESDEFMKMYREAGQRAREEDRTKPRALSAIYNPEDRRIHVELTTGALFAFPVDLSQGVAGGADEDIANLEILGNGHAFHWPALDADLLLEPLMAGVYGSRRWMEELERKGFGAMMRRKPAAKRTRVKRGRPRKRASKAGAGVSRKRRQRN